MEAMSSLREKSDAFHRDITSPAAHNSPALGPVADLARSKSYHSIEYTCYISKKGQRPRVLSGTPLQMYELKSLYAKMNSLAHLVEYDILNP